jgi:hypothetical protein
MLVGAEALVNVYNAIAGAAGAAPCLLHCLLFPQNREFSYKFALSDVSDSSTAGRCRMHKELLCGAEALANIF